MSERKEVHAGDVWRRRSGPTSGACVLVGHTSTGYAHLVPVVEQDGNGRVQYGRRRSRKKITAVQQEMSLVAREPELRLLAWEERG
ncbi:MAG: hypothetical protein KC492_08480 [Myxococcales bacterium]|nr:hypothetical protein [Myxococcales bacterium]